MKRKSRGKSGIVDKVIAEVSLTIIDAKQLPSKVNKRKVFVKWKRGRLKDSNARTKIAIASKGCAEWNETAIFKTTLNRFTTPKGEQSFESKRLQIHIRYEGRVKKRRVCHTHIDLADYVSLLPVDQTKANSIHFGKGSNDPVLNISVTASWLRLNGKAIQRRKGSKSEEPVEGKDFDLVTVDDGMTADGTYSTGATTSTEEGTLSDDSDVEGDGGKDDKRKYRHSMDATKGKRNSRIGENKGKKRNSRISHSQPTKTKKRNSEELDKEDTSSSKKRNSKEFDKEGTSSSKKRQSKELDKKSIKKKLDKQKRRSRIATENEMDWKLKIEHVNSELEASKEAMLTKEAELKKVKRKLQKSLDNAGEYETEIGGLRKEVQTLKYQLIEKVSSEVASASVGGGADVLELQEKMDAEIKKWEKKVADLKKQNRKFTDEILTKEEEILHMKEKSAIDTDDEKEHLENLVAKMKKKVSKLKHQLKEKSEQLEEYTSSGSIQLMDTESDDAEEDRILADMARITRLGNSFVQTGSTTMWAGAFVGVLVLFLLRYILLWIIF